MTCLRMSEPTGQPWQERPNEVRPWGLGLTAGVEAANWRAWSSKGGMAKPMWSGFKYYELTYFDVPQVTIVRTESMRLIKTMG